MEWKVESTMRLRKVYDIMREKESSLLITSCEVHYIVSYNCAVIVSTERFAY